MRLRKVEIHAIELKTVNLSKQRSLEEVIICKCGMEQFECPNGNLLRSVILQHNKLKRVNFKNQSNIAEALLDPLERLILKSQVQKLHISELNERRTLIRQQNLREYKGQEIHNYTLLNKLVDYSIEQYQHYYRNQCVVSIRKRAHWKLHNVVCKSQKLQDSISRGR